MEEVEAETQARMGEELGPVTEKIGQDSRDPKASHPSSLGLEGGAVTQGGLSGSNAHSIHASSTSLTPSDKKVGVRVTPAEAGFQ